MTSRREQSKIFISPSPDQNFQLWKKRHEKAKKKAQFKFVTVQCSSYKTFSRQIPGAPATNGISRVSSKTCHLLPSARVTNSVEQPTGQPNPKMEGILVLELATIETIVVLRPNPRDEF